MEALYPNLRFNIAYWLCILFKTYVIQHGTMITENVDKVDNMNKINTC